jgi:acetoacetyl-CoA reductase
MSRIAIGTGGTRGIGEAICRRLQEQGFTVVANYGGNDAKAKAFTDETGIPAYKWDVGDHQAALDVGAADVGFDALVFGGNQAVLHVGLLVGSFRPFRRIGLE